MKVTAVAPANIAFIKYWGKQNNELRLPMNGSISVNLSHLKTTTTVEFSPDKKKDEVIVDGKKEAKIINRVVAHLDRIRNLAHLDLKAKVVSQNNFPRAAGMASSASGFAALTLAAVRAAEMSLSEKELSILARIGSGSACRSIPDGFVEWLKGMNSTDSYALSLYEPDYWQIVVIAIIIKQEVKEVTSSKGHELVKKNPFYSVRLSRIIDKIELLKKYLKERDFIAFGELVEAEALEMHALTMTSYPPILYWQPETLKVMKLVQAWRKVSLPVFFTIDAGPNIFLLLEKKDLEKTKNKLAVSGIKNFIINYPDFGARTLNKHLF